jgi:RNA polymerase sigma factor (sigma-70 family)
MAARYESMAASPLNMVIQHLLAGLGPDGGGMTDGELLARFLSSRDDNTLAALVRRHAPMVWGVCSRLLHNHHDAEDAFQATFLVLVRKAANVPRQAVANWLYGVARQTAVRLRALAAKRGRRQTQVVNMPEPTVAEVRDADLQSMLDEELSRLPDHYRGVIVLCDLEGMTRKEAARQLGIPEGSVASRQARARVMLAKRLTRRGVVFSGASVSAVLSAGARSASASAPPALVASTIKAASLLAAGRAAGVVSAKVAALTEGVLKTMLLNKLTATKSLAGMLTVIAVIMGLYAYYGFAQPPAAQAVKAQARTPDTRKTDNDDQQKAPSASDKERLQGTWVTVSAESGGKPVAKETIRPQWWHFEDDKVTIYSIDLRFSKPEKTEYTFALATKKSPKVIEMTGGRRLEGPRTKPPGDFKGIYKIEADSLTIAQGNQGLPTEFKTKEGDGVFMSVLKREGAAKEKP